MAFELPLDELEVRASRAGGPGGQHVNTSATRIEVRWNVRTTEALSETQRDRLLARLGSRVARDGTLRVVSGARRSQAQNREAAIARMDALVREALTVQRPRRAAAPSRAQRQKRLDEKRRRGRRKADRRRPGDDE